MKIVRLGLGCMLLFFVTRAVLCQIIKTDFVSLPDVQAVHASSIIEVSPHVFLVAYFGGPGQGPMGNKIYVSRYENGKWGSACNVVHAGEVASISEPGYDYVMSCWDPVLFKLPNGRIVLFYKIGNSPRGWTGFLKWSDDGMSWEPPVQLPAGIVGPTKNTPVLLKNGYVLCPSSVESWRSWACWVDCIRLDNFMKHPGRGWVKTGPIVYDSCPWGIIQPTLFVLGECGHEHKEEVIRMVCRTKNVPSGLLATSISYDSGKTWSPVTDIALRSNDSAISGINLNDGRLLLVYNDQPQGMRNKLDLALSSDGGATWQHVFCIEDSSQQDEQICYPSVIQDSEGFVHVTYTCNHRRQIKHVIIDPTRLISH
jgi:predicted neuraminidase